MYNNSVNYFNVDYNIEEKVGSSLANFVKWLSSSFI